MLSLKRLAVVVATIAITTAALAANLQTSGDLKKSKTLEEKFKIPDGTKSKADTVRFFEWSAILYFNDSSYWDYIRVTGSFTTFVQRVSSHQQKHPEMWLRALGGLSWATDSAKCFGFPWQPEVDVRWKYFLRFGSPSAHWEPLYEAAASSDTLQTFFYWWNGPDTGLAAQEVRDTSKAVLVGSLQGDTLKSKFGKDLYPELDVVSFPNWDNTFDLGVVVGITGDRLTKETLVDKKCLEYKLHVFQNDSLIFEENRSGKLGLTGLILSVTANDKDVTLPEHFTIPCLSAGKYEIKLYVEGDQNNSGKAKATTWTVLADRGLSDILLVEKYPVQGEAVQNGIDRLGRRLVGRVSHTFKNGDTLSMYAEIPALADSESALLLKAYVSPVKDTLSIESKVVVPTSDSADNPLASWAGVDINKANTDQEVPLETSPDLDLLFAKAYRGADSSSGALIASFQLKELKLGEYWLGLVAEVYNSEGRLVLVRPIRTKIRIKSPEPFFLGKF